MHSLIFGGEEKEGRGFGEEGRENGKGNERLSRRSRLERLTKKVCRYVFIYSRGGVQLAQTLVWLTMVRSLG